jgi:predicted metal-dependent HD superfamily phosphohydrolase
MRGADAWRVAVRRLGGRPEPAAAAAAELERRWAEPHRRYHTGAHLEAVLRDSAWLADEVGLDAVDRAVLTLAACAHDVVYDAVPGEDERASADWARQQLTDCGVPRAAVERVAGLVLATVAHDAAADDPAAAVLLDADLAVLAGQPSDYARYAAAVRQEYAAVADADFRAGRARVLAALLERTPLFRTAPARQRWEEAARRNVAAELAVLRRGAAE